MFVVFNSSDGYYFTIFEVLASAFLRIRFVGIRCVVWIPTFRRIVMPYLQGQ
jgi:hypothetical protein